MQLIEVIYLTSSAVAVLAMAPQIKQILVTKETDELNATSWSAWLGNQVVALFYAISINAVPYIIINFAWIAFYILMIVLIVKYRSQTSAKEQLITVPIEVK